MCCFKEIYERNIIKRPSSFNEISFFARWQKLLEEIFSLFLFLNWKIQRTSWTPWILFKITFSRSFGILILVFWSRLYRWFPTFEKKFYKQYRRKNTCLTKTQNTDNFLMYKNYKFWTRRSFIFFPTLLLVSFTFLRCQKVITVRSIFFKSVKCLQFLRNFTVLFVSLF